MSPKPDELELKLQKSHALSDKSAAAGSKGKARVIEKIQGAADKKPKPAHKGKR